MENVILLIKIVKWLLIFVTISTNSTLAWRILRKESLHSLFNLSMCFYFIFIGSIFPIMINEYGDLLTDMIMHPDVPNPQRCQIIYVCRMMSLQGFKVFMMNLMFRSIIIQFSHYGIGLSNSFSNGGTKHWILRVSYFAILLSFVSMGSGNVIVKSYKEEMMEHIVKGRICLLLRFVIRKSSDMV